MTSPERCVSCGGEEFATGDIVDRRPIFKLHRGGGLLKRYIAVAGYCCLACGHLHLRAYPDAVRRGLQTSSS